MDGALAQSRGSKSCVIIHLELRGGDKQAQRSLPSLPHSLQSSFPRELVVEGPLEKRGEGSLLSAKSERGNAGLPLQPSPNTEATGRQGHPVYNRLLSYCLHLGASKCTPDPLG